MASFNWFPNEWPHNRQLISTLNDTITLNLHHQHAAAASATAAADDDHDDVIKWKHIPRYWPFVRGIHRSTANSPHKDQWRGALMFSLICARLNCWVNNRDAGDLKRHRAYYDVIVMWWLLPSLHLYSLVIITTISIYVPNVVVVMMHEWTSFGTPVAFLFSLHCFRLLLIHLFCFVFQAIIR